MLERQGDRDAHYECKSATGRNERVRVSSHFWWNNEREPLTRNGMFICISFKSACMLRTVSWPQGVSVIG